MHCYVSLQDVYFIEARCAATGLRILWALVYSSPDSFLAVKIPAGRASGQL